MGRPLWLYVLSVQTINTRENHYSLFRFLSLSHSLTLLCLHFFFCLEMKIIQECVGSLWGRVLTFMHTSKNIGKLVWFFTTQFLPTVFHYISCYFQPGNIFINSGNSLEPRNRTFLINILVRITSIYSPMMHTRIFRSVYLAAVCAATSEGILKI